MKTLKEIIEQCKDGQIPAAEDCFYTILALDFLLTGHHEQLGVMCQAGSIGRPFSSERSREVFKEANKRLWIASGSDPKALCGDENDPQQPDYQERRRKAKAEALTKKRLLSANNRH